MKRFLALLLLFAFALSMFTACDNGSDNSSSDDSKTEETPMTPDKNAKLVWSDLYADKNGGFENAESVYKLTAYSNGVTTDKYDSIPEGDTRFLFEGTENTRVAVLSDGYTLTLAEEVATFSLRRPINTFLPFLMRIKTPTVRMHKPV